MKDEVPVQRADLKVYVVGNTANEMGDRRGVGKSYVNLEGFLNETNTLLIV